LFAGPGLSDKTIELRTAAAFTPLQGRPCSASQEPAEKVNENRCNVNEGFAEKFTGNGARGMASTLRAKIGVFQKMAIVQVIYKKNKHKHRIFSQKYVKSLARNVKNSILRLTS